MDLDYPFKIQYASADVKGHCVTCLLKFNSGELRIAEMLQVSEIPSK